MENYLSTTSFYMHLQFVSVTEMLPSLFVCAVAESMHVAVSVAAGTTRIPVTVADYCDCLRCVCSWN